MNDTEKKLADIAREVRECEKCPLSRTRIQAVPGSGGESSGIVFVGEGPGAQEDKQGLPFVGAAGKFLDEMLGEIGLKREEVFITNVVKCRPPDNRDPYPEEVDVCTRLYLWRQLSILRPRLLVTLGRHAMGRFLPSDKRISSVHGTLFRLHNPKTGKSLSLLPLYHPAAALYNGSMREVLLRDFRKIPAILKKESAPERETDEGRRTPPDSGSSSRR